MSQNLSVSLNGVVAYDEDGLPILSNRLEHYCLHLEMCCKDLRQNLPARISEQVIEAVSEHFEESNVETKVDNLDKKVDRLNYRFKRLDEKVNKLDEKMDKMSSKIDRVLDRLEAVDTRSRETMQNNKQILLSINNLNTMMMEHNISAAGKLITTHKYSY